jgi:hypothetical protein
MLTLDYSNWNKFLCVEKDIIIIWAWKVGRVNWFFSEQICDFTFNRVQPFYDYHFHLSTFKHIQISQICFWGNYLQSFPNHKIGWGKKKKKNPLFNPSIIKCISSKYPSNSHKFPKKLALYHNLKGFANKNFTHKIHILFTCLSLSFVMKVTTVL